jgi:mono/diheme cytochrome c family protein
MLRSLSLAILLATLSFASAWAQDAEAAKRGQYIFDVAGCFACHTDVKNNGKPLAGGRSFPTPFGTFYGPNITPDRVNGIGAWSEADFIRAMRQGVAADGSNLFPVFPFPSFTQMTDADLKDLYAYLMAQPPDAQPNKPHEVHFPFNFRIFLTGWKLLNYTAGAYRPDRTKSAEWNRGAYLVTALAHCAQCHTPRNFMRGLELDQWLSGTAEGPDGERIPNITPDLGTGIGEWSRADLEDLLKTGMKPDGDSVGGSMGEVVQDSTSKLTDADLKAIVTYLKALTPIKNSVRKKS